MKRFILFFVSFQLSLFANEANLSVGNFVDTGSSITFDIMMTNDVPVGGFQFNLMLGNGTFDDDPDCICTSATVTMDQLPDGCDECYYDYGVDKIRNAYEEDTNTSTSYSFGCESTGECSAAIDGENNPTDSTCERSGSCSDNSGECGKCENVLYETQYSCAVLNNLTWDTASYSDFTDEVSCLANDGVWDEVYTFASPSSPGDTQCSAVGDCSVACDGGAVCDSECECVWAGGVWTDDEDYYWVPDNSFIPYETPSECIAAYDCAIDHDTSSSSDCTDDDEYLIWDYYNPDGNNDDYKAVEDQFCHRTDRFGSNYHIQIDSFGSENEDYLEPGECSYREAVCVSKGETSEDENGNIIPPEFPIGTILDWPSSCCTSTQGAEMFYPARDKDVCNGVVEFNNIDYDLIGDTVDSWEWTPWDTQQVCEDNAGIWHGDVSGTEGNNQFDEGEYFIEGTSGVSLNISPSMDLLMLSWALQVQGNLVIGVSFTGSTLPVNDTPLVIATATASYSDLNGIHEIFADYICGSGQSSNWLDPITGDPGDWSGTNCPADLTISDASGLEIPSTFTPFLWDVGEGGSDFSNNDGVCSKFGGWGETINDDVACSAYCGDRICNGDEDYASCASDCDETCGDGICSLFEVGETADNCPADCSEFGCGDFICSDDETTENCSNDCPASYCGDGNYDWQSGESYGNCTIDYVVTCGDGYWDQALETAENCPQDAGGSYCGDGSYDYLEGETHITCPEDYIVTCDDGYFDYAGGEIEECDCLNLTCSANEALCGDNCCVCEDYVVTCGDGIYHYSSSGSSSYTISGLTGVESIDTCPQDYQVTCDDGFYDWQGLVVLGLCADSLPSCEENDDSYDVALEEYAVCQCSQYDASCDDSVEGAMCYCMDYVTTSGDGYCEAADSSSYIVVGDNADPENPGNEEACDSNCGDGFFNIGVETYSSGNELTDCSADYPLGCLEPLTGVQLAYCCNDGYCDSANNEDYTVCPSDCPPPDPANGICELWGGESFLTTSDCISECGDGIYDYIGSLFDVCEGCNAGVGLETHENCSQDYTQTCGDGYYDYIDPEVGSPEEGDENFDGPDIADEGEPELPDCIDYIPTCGDGVYDFSNAGGEGLIQGSTVNLQSQADANEGLCDYVVTCGDGFCDLAMDVDFGDSNLDGVIDENEITINDSYELYENPVTGELTDNCPEDCTVLDINQSVPHEFTVSSNYPNPFNPTTTIAYTVMSAGDVTVSIYDIRGREVFELVNGFHVPGIQYEATWDALNQSNRPISAGVYFYEVRSGDNVKRFKMAFVK